MIKVRTSCLSGAVVTSRVPQITSRGRGLGTLTRWLAAPSFEVTCMLYETTQLKLLRTGFNNIIQQDSVLCHKTASVIIPVTRESDVLKGEALLMK